MSLLSNLCFCVAGVAGITSVGAGYAADSQKTQGEQGELENKGTVEYKEFLEGPAPGRDW